MATLIGVLLVVGMLGAVCRHFWTIGPIPPNLRNGGDGGGGGMSGGGCDGGGGDGGGGD